MSVATKLQSPVSEPRAILGPGGNRVVRVSEKSETLKKKPQRTTTTATATRNKPVSEVPPSVVRSNASVDSSCSSDSSSSGSLAKTSSSMKTTAAKRKGLKLMNVPPDGVEVAKILGPSKRCDWITSNSDPIYAYFHDEEWGVPIHDDQKLFELLVFSQALAELPWPAILNRRDIFRKLFDNFDPSSVAQFNEKKLLSLKVNGNLVLSEPKLRAIVENAKQILKVQQELGSFSNYCWAFTNRKPIRNGFRYGRQVPVKSPKADLISKDMMLRGFRCVGPTVIYSFMQASGIVNDHLVGCYRYQDCNHINNETVNKKTGGPGEDERLKDLSEALLEKASLLSSNDSEID